MCCLKVIELYLRDEWVRQKEFECTTPKDTRTFWLIRISVHYVLQPHSAILMTWACFDFWLEEMYTGTVTLTYIFSYLKLT